jgi:hypothetical protein
VNGVSRMICSVWWPTGTEAINRQAPRAKGCRTGPETPWADPNRLDGPGPFWAGSGPSSSPVASCMVLYLCALSCGPITSFPSQLRHESLL